MIPRDWQSAYSHDVTPALAPIVPPRSPAPSTSSARMIHVLARPTYTARCRRHASPKLPLTNVRSYNSTTSGTVTITSFVAIPTAHVTTAKLNHLVRDPSVAPRRNAYTTSR